MNVQFIVSHIYVEHACASQSYKKINKISVLILVNIDHCGMNAFLCQTMPVYVHSFYISY